VKIHSAHAHTDDGARPSLALPSKPSITMTIVLDVTPTELERVLDAFIKGRDVDLYTVQNS
jgi:hypothetical protein